MQVEAPLEPLCNRIALLQERIARDHAHPLEGAEHDVVRKQRRLPPMKGC